jgi:excisionase family DNA binding protein
MTEPLLLTIADAARQLACSTRLVEKLIYSGDLRSVRLGKRARRVPRTDLTDYIDRLRGDHADPGLVGRDGPCTPERKRSLSLDHSATLKRRMRRDRTPARQ